MKKLLLAILGKLGLGKSNADTALDFSHVDSREKAVQLAEEGKLFEMLLYPAELGGEDVPQNIIYVPAGVPEIKDKITGTVVNFAQDGLIDNLKIDLEYKGSSFIPSKICMQTSHSGKAGGFNPTIKVW